MCNDINKLTDNTGKKADFLRLPELVTEKTGMRLTHKSAG